ETLKKPVGELSEDDYIAHGLASLAMANSSDHLNAWAAQTLTSKLRVHAALPHDERIILFSPHPDDDVISAGGIFRKLVENKNDVYVAYQTSGNIAVFDHDVLRYLDFVGKYLATMKIDTAGHTAIARKIERTL